MSTETKPLKLVPFTRRIGASGRLVIEPGAKAPFELPGEFRSLFEALERGSSLSGLVDHVDPAKAGSRFRLIKKFLVFLDEHDVLADRDYARLAESLVTEFTWPTSALTTDLLEIPLARRHRRARGVILPVMALVATLALAGVSLAAMMFIFASGANGSGSNDGAELGLLRTLLLFLVTFSAARSGQAFWAWLVSASGGMRARLDLVVEPVSIRLRQEQHGKPVRLLVLLAQAISFLLFFGIAAGFCLLARSRFEFEVVILAGSFAFFTETSPYSRSSITELLRSLYANLEERRTDSALRERAIRQAHVSISVAWILFLGIFLAVDVGSVLTQGWALVKTAAGAPKIAGYALLAMVALFVLNWFADVIGSFSYSDATSGQIRKLWRRKSETSISRVEGLAPSPQDLERLPFLRQIPADARKQLLFAAQVRPFAEGQAICRQGDRDRHLFVVLEGKLAVAAQSGSGARRRRKIVAWLDPGAVFGENSFFFGQPRSADVVGMESGRVLVVPHSNSMKLVDAERSDELRVRIWFLQALMQSEFFKSLPSESLDAILHAGVEQRFGAGTTVIQEGQEADACYFMVQGRASVTQKTRAVGKMNAGDAFGEISILFPGMLRTATIVADTDLITIKIDRDRFWKLLKAHLPLALEIERLGLRRLRKDQERSVSA